MVYSATTGNLLEWTDPSGEQLLYNQGERPNTADIEDRPDQAAAVVTDSPLDVFPFRLYVLQDVSEVLYFHADPFTTQDMTICEIPNDTDHVQLAFPVNSWIDGDWYYQRWVIRAMHGDYKFTDPRYPGIGKRKPVDPGDCTFEDTHEQLPILTVVARTYVGPYAGTSAWGGLSATINGSAIHQEQEEFGVFAVEWPILTGFQSYSPGELAWPTRNGMLLKDPLSVLLSTGAPEMWAYEGELPPASPALIEKIDSGTVNMMYPMGYDMAMQFFTYYQPRPFGSTGRPYGNLWYASDASDRTKMKQFRFKAESGDQYSVSFIHYNDNVCSHYSPEDAYSVGPLVTRRYCNHRDFEEIDYEIRQTQFSYTLGGGFMELIGGNWMEAAKWYRNWVRSAPGGAPWLRDNAPLASRTGALWPYGDFYQRTGFTLFNVGAGFRLADPRLNTTAPRYDDDNFLRKYQKILYSPDGQAKVNYVLGWDFHHRDLPMRRSGMQNGKCGMDGNCADVWSDWRATFAGVDYRLNRDVILPTDGITPTLGYVNPYLFGLHMYYRDSFPLNPNWVFDWAEWIEEAGETTKTPWLGHTAYVGFTGCFGDSRGGCPLDPTQDDCYHHLIQRSRHLALDPFDNDPPDENNPPATDRISGVYQDIGVSFAVPGAFRSHQAEGIIKAHRAGSALAEEADDDATATDQVGMGGFVWEAQRNMIEETRRNASDVADTLLGTEQMTEVFIDKFDYYGSGEGGLGPLRPFRVPADDDDDDDDDACLANFVFPDDAIMAGNAVEIPMLQYVYHPMMPIRMDGAWFSGSHPSTPSFPYGGTYDSGDIYYWVAARAYFDYGAMIQMYFSESEIDVLSFSDPSYSFLPVMDQNTPSYRLGWWRDTANPETVVGDLQKGKHSAGSTERAIGDPPKMAYLRLAAAIRSYIVPTFLVYGEKRTTGVMVNDMGAHDYSYYFFTAKSNSDLATELEHCSSVSQFDHCEHECGAFSAEPFVTASWQNYGSGSPLKILHIVANATNTVASPSLTIDRVPEYSGYAYYQARVYSPTVANMAPVYTRSWTRFSPGGTSNLAAFSIPAHGVALVLLCQNQTCSY
jgi:hypothetical protein